MRKLEKQLIFLKILEVNQRLAEIWGVIIWEKQVNLGKNGNLHGTLVFPGFLCPLPAPPLLCKQLALMGETSRLEPQKNKMSLESFKASVGDWSLFYLCGGFLDDPLAGLSLFEPTETSPNMKNFLLSGCQKWWRWSGENKRIAKELKGKRLERDIHKGFEKF